MRFGRNSPPSDSDTENIPGTFLDQDHVQRISREDQDPFLRIGRQYPQDPDPFLRIGRTSYYMRFGKRELPYLKFGRDYVPRNDEEDLILRLGKNGIGLLNPDMDYSPLAGTLDYGHDVNDRKKRSASSQREQTNLQSVLAPVIGGTSGTVSEFKDAGNKELDEQTAREARGGNQYMRFGKKNSLAYYDSSNYNQDKETESAGDEQEKRINEYMRFGRGLEDNMS